MPRGAWKRATPGSLAARGLSTATLSPAHHRAMDDRRRHCSHEWSWVRRPAQRFLLPDWLAITIGRHVISWRRLDEVELAHELKHVEQWACYGLRFIPRYLVAGRRAAAKGGDRYRDNPFEIEARAAEEAALARTAGRAR